MSVGTARRTSIEVLFDGVDITKTLQSDLLSLTYTDSEEEEADDLQIKLHDRSGIWLQRWLPAAVEAAVSQPAPAATSGWQLGDEVLVSGRPQYSSYGNGTPGATVTNHKGRITYLNLQNGIPYPIHVDYLGWFAEGQVQKAGADAAAVSDKSGLKIRAAITREIWEVSGKLEKLPCGEFELDSVDLSGPPAVITLKASALPYSAQIRQTKKSRTWEACKLSDIAKDIASAGGLECLFESADNPQYDSVEQRRQSDIRFLSQLCRDAGISLKVTASKLVLFDQKTYEAKPPVRTLRPGSGYLSYRLYTGETDTQYASCHVSYTAPDGSLIEATAYVEDYDAKAKNNQCLEISARIADIAQAKTLAEKQLRLHNKYAKTAVFTLPGDVRLVAGAAVQLSGWGLWDGKYLIDQAVHTVGSGGYTVRLSLRMVLEGY